MEFIHSVLAQDVPITAGIPMVYDLPVNPLSHIYVTVPYIRTAAAAAGVPRIVNTLTMFTRMEVLYKGSAIFSMSGIDAVAAGLYITNFESWGVNFAGIIGEEASFTWCIPLGRVLYNPNECFPRSTRGELQLQITPLTPLVDITFAGTVAQIETVELPDASPTQYLRMTTLSAAMPAGGEFDVPLPIGNPISDLVLWGATIPVGAVKVRTLDYLQILIDNQRRFYSHTNYETHHNMAGRMRAAPGYWGGHQHWVAAAPGLTEDVIACNHILSCYSHLPFDIFRNGEYALQTSGKSDVILRINNDLAAATTARVIPCEIVPAGAGV